MELIKNILGILSIIFYVSWAVLAVITDSRRKDYTKNKDPYKKEYVDLGTRPTQHYMFIDGDWAEVDEEGEIITYDVDLKDFLFDAPNHFCGTVTNVKTYPHLTDRLMMLATGNWFDRMLFKIIMLKRKLLI